MHISAVMICKTRTVDRVAQERLTHLRTSPERYFYRREMPGNVYNGALSMQAPRPEESNDIDGFQSDHRIVIGN